METIKLTVRHEGFCFVPVLFCKITHLISINYSNGGTRTCFLRIINVYNFVVRAIFGTIIPKIKQVLINLNIYNN